MDLENIRGELEDRVDGEMKRLQVPGVALGVLLEDRELTLCRGITNVDHPLPVDDRTLFQIGSTTKTFVATALMQEVERGALDLDAPLRSYLPEFSLQDESYAERVTTRHLLTHTGGWLGDYFVLRPVECRGDEALKRIVESMPRVPILTAPGEQFSYNNAAFDVAGHLLEVLTGSCFEDVVRERVFEPLGLEHSFLFPEEAITERLAVGHIVGPGGLEVARPWALRRTEYASGGIISDVCDQLRYARFHLGNGLGAKGERVLAPETLAEMQRIHAGAGAHVDGIGLPWMIGRVGGARVVRHGGATNGFMSAFDMVPERRFAVTVLTNADEGSTLHGLLVSWILERVLGLKNEPPRLLERTPEELEEFVGSYALGYATIESDGGQLRVELKAVPGAAKEQPPFRIAFTDADRVIGVEEPFDGARGEFLRDDAGGIRFFRWGGRLLPRHAEPDDELSSSLG
jgi:CubicO group peptidase (beta-lactamase class C family)